VGGNVFRLRRVSIEIYSTAARRIGSVRNGGETCKVEDSSSKLQNQTELLARPMLTMERPQDHAGAAEGGRSD
jgi:hypothetical protein